MKEVFASTLIVFGMAGCAYRCPSEPTGLANYLPDRPIDATLAENTLALMPIGIRATGRNTIIIDLAVQAARGNSIGPGAAIITILEHDPARYMQLRDAENNAVQLRPKATYRDGFLGPSISYAGVAWHDLSDGETRIGWAQIEARTEPKQVASGLYAVHFLEAPKSP